MSEEVKIAPPNHKYISVKIKFTNPLVLHAHPSADKAKEIQKIIKRTKAEKRRNEKSLDEEYKKAFYYGVPSENGGELRIPTYLFRGAMEWYISDKQFSKLDKQWLRRRLRFTEADVLVEYDEIKRREFRPRQKGISRAVDVRPLPVVLGASCVLLIKYNADLTDAEEVVNILALAGEWAGIGDYRPNIKNQCEDLIGGTWMIISGEEKSAE